jgi:ribosomal protein S18 acetylase RimI-like enzyme
LAEEITVRPMLPSDGPALNKLNSETPDTGALAFYTEFHGDPFTILTTLDPDTHGVVAQAPDHEGIVGMGLVTFGQCMYEGELRPSAYLSSLSVHPSYRRRGIASKLSSGIDDRIYGVVKL